MKAGELSSCLTIGNRSNRSRRARFLSIYMLFVKLAKFKIVEAVSITANVYRDRPDMIVFASHSDD